MAAIVLALIVLLPRPSPPASPAVDPPPPRSSATEPARECSPAAAADWQPSTGARVNNGLLSYPKLGAPFTDPFWDELVELGPMQDMQSQAATLRYQGKVTGGAEVLIGRLVGDGLTSPRQVDLLLADCVVRYFFGANTVDRTDRSNRATDVDGHRAWAIEMHLTYGVVAPGVRSSTYLLLVIATSPGVYGLAYANLPDTHPELIPVVKRAFADLRVS